MTEVGRILLASTCEFAGSAAVEQQHNSEGANDAYRHPNVPHFDQSSSQFAGTENPSSNAGASARMEMARAGAKRRRCNRGHLDLALDGRARRDAICGSDNACQSIFHRHCPKGHAPEIDQGAPNHIRRHYADGHTVCECALETAQCAVSCAVRLPALPRFAKLLSFEGDIGDADKSYRTIFRRSNWRRSSSGWKD